VEGTVTELLEAQTLPSCGVSGCINKSVIKVRSLSAENLNPEATKLSAESLNIIKYIRVALLEMHAGWLSANAK
jgi:hypothetical protein